MGQLREKLAPRNGSQCNHSGYILTHYESASWLQGRGRVMVPKARTQ